MILSQDIPVPMPGDWSEIYLQLKNLIEQRIEHTIPEPPVPLILAGAAFSTANQIRTRWKELVDWSNKYGFADEMAKMIPPSPQEDVAERIAGVSENSKKHWWEDLASEDE